MAEAPSILQRIELAMPNGERWSWPALVFGVWAACPGVGGLWRVTHVPTGRRLGGDGDDMHWIDALAVAEDMHRTFGDKMPSDTESAWTVIRAAIARAEALMASTDWSE